MVQPQLRLGFISIARTTFDIPLAEEVTARARAHLEAGGFALAGPEGLVTTVEQIEAALKPLVANKPDLMVVFQATFADSTMVMRIAKPINTPLVLWAIPEAPTGGRLRLNALCGITLAGHALTRAKQHFESIYAPADDPGVPDRMRTLAAAGRVRRMLRHTYVGQVGKPPDGFETCIPHPALLKARFGIKVVPLDLDNVFAEARSTDPARVNALRDTLSQQIDGLDEVDQSALNGTLASYAALRDIARRERLTAFAVRCWPQFFTEMGCAACGALSMLNEEKMPAACETDVNGAITQLILQWISGDVAFDADLVSFDLRAGHSGAVALRQSTNEHGRSRRQAARDGAFQPPEAAADGVSAQARPGDHRPPERSQRRVPAGDRARRDAARADQLWRHVGRDPLRAARRGRARHAVVRRLGTSRRADVRRSHGRAAGAGQAPRSARAAAVAGH